LIPRFRGDEFTPARDPALRELKAGVSDLDVKYLHNFGPQIGFNIYKLLEIAESSQGQNTPLEVVITQLH